MTTLTPRQQRLEQAEQFLTMLFGNLDGSGHFYLWTLPERKGDKPTSHWYQTVGDAMDFVRDNLDIDIYVGRTVSSEKGTEGERVKNAAAEGVVALVADMDYYHDLHSKRDQLPPDYQAVMQIADEIPLAPSMRVHTGHGIHLWWVFEEPWMFDSQEERDEAIDLSRRWHMTLKTDMESRGYTIDSVFDLARVMRIPGTMNTKNPNRPTPVGMHVFNEDFYYNPSDFEPFLIDDHAQQEIRDVVERGSNLFGTLKINPAAQMTPGMTALITRNSYARDLWGKEAGVAPSDNSQSGWDLSLANLLVSEGFEPQAIVDNLIAYRSMHNEKDKLRHDYYYRTLMKANNQTSSTRRSEQSSSALEELTYMVAEGKPEQGVERWRSEVLRLVSAVLTDQHDINVSEVRAYSSDPKTYIFVVNGNELSKQGPKIFMSQVEFIGMIIEGAGVKVPKMKTEDWDTISKALLDACREVENVDATDRDIIADIIDDFIQMSDHSFEAVFQAEPSPVLIEGDQILINDIEFGQYLTRVHSINKGKGKLSMILDSLGCSSSRVTVQINARRGAKKRRVRYWYLPKDLFPVQSYIVDDRDYVLREGIREND